MSAENKRKLDIASSKEQTSPKRQKKPYLKLVLVENESYPSKSSMATSESNKREKIFAGIMLNALKQNDHLEIFDDADEQLQKIYEYINECIKTGKMDEKSELLIGNYKLKKEIKERIEKNNWGKANIVINKRYDVTIISRTDDYKHIDGDETNYRTYWCPKKLLKEFFSDISYDTIDCNEKYCNAKDGLKICWNQKYDCGDDDFNSFCEHFTKLYKEEKYEEAIEYISIECISIKAEYRTVPRIEYSYSIHESEKLIIE